MGIEGIVLEQCKGSPNITCPYLDSKIGKMFTDMEKEVLSWS